MLSRSPTAAVQQEVIRLAASGNSYNGIAKQLGLTKGQVAGILFRAKGGKAQSHDALQPSANDAQQEVKKCQ